MGSALGEPTKDWLGPLGIAALAAALGSAPSRRWRADAACREYDAALFYGGAVRSAQKVCSSCPVALDCLVAALRNDLAADEVTDCEKGVWGGTTEPVRRLIVRALRDRGVAAA